MRFKREITTLKQQERELASNLKKSAGALYKENWHQKFVMHHCLRDYENNSKTHVWFETIERKGRWVSERVTLESLSGGYWHWEYRLPKESK